LKDAAGAVVTSPIVCGRDNCGQEVVARCMARGTAQLAGGGPVERFSSSSHAHVVTCEDAGSVSEHCLL
jgi:hypothetical protein